jgi:hypothetical protein
LRTARFWRTAGIAKRAACLNNSASSENTLAGQSEVVGSYSAQTTSKNMALIDTPNLLLCKASNTFRPPEIELTIFKPMFEMELLYFPLL